MASFGVAALLLGGLAWWQTRPLSLSPASAEPPDRATSSPTPRLMLATATPDPSPLPTPSRTPLALEQPRTEGSPPALAPERDRGRELEELLDQGRLEEACVLIERILARTEQPQLRILRASLLHRLGRTSAAGMELLAVAEPDRDGGWHFVRGWIDYEQGRGGAARVALARAVALGAGSEAARLLEQVLRELAAVGQLRSHRSTHFALAVEGEGEGGRLRHELVREVLEASERSYRRLNRDFRLSPTEPIPILLLRRRSFRETTAAPDWAEGLFDGKIRIPAAHLAGVSEPLERLITHELTHALIQLKSGPNCPRWLHEGLAQHYEGRSFAADLSNRESRSGPVGPERAKLATDPALFYLQSLGRAEHLLDSYGRTRVMLLLERLRTLDWGRAVHTTLGVDDRGLERQYRGWLARQ